jgi:hypothetical protein
MLELLLWQSSLVSGESTLSKEVYGEAEKAKMLYVAVKIGSARCRVSMHRLHEKDETKMILKRYKVNSAT